MSYYSLNPYGGTPYNPMQNEAQNQCSIRIACDHGKEMGYLHAKSIKDREEIGRLKANELRLKDTHQKEMREETRKREDLEKDMQAEIKKRELLEEVHESDMQVEMKKRESLEDFVYLCLYHSPFYSFGQTGSLPSEVWVMILQYLQCDKDLIAMRGVSRFFATVIRCSPLERRMVLKVQ